MKKTLYALALSITLIMSDLACSDQIIAPPLYTARDFSSLLGHVKGLNDELLSMHFKLYEGYVKNTNILLQTLADMSDGSPAFGALKRRLGWEYDGMRLHELYFESLMSPQPLSEQSLLYKAIVKDFGSYDAWKKDFITTGLMRGIGWVILYLEPIQGRLLNVWIDEHDVGHLAGAQPILVMDVWEHAYITEYGLDRAQYINVFLDAINWCVVNRRF